MTRKLRRKTGDKEQKKVFVIATDGTKTEPRYFDHFKGSNKITIKVIWTSLSLVDNYPLPDEAISKSCGLS